MAAFIHRTAQNGAEHQMMRKYNLTLKFYEVLMISYDIVKVFGAISKRSSFLTLTSYNCILHPLLTHMPNLDLNIDLHVPNYYNCTFIVYNLNEAEQLNKVVVKQRRCYKM